MSGCVYFYLYGYGAYNSSTHLFFLLRFLVYWQLPEAPITGNDPESHEREPTNLEVGVSIQEMSKVFNPLVSRRERNSCSWLRTYPHVLHQLVRAESGKEEGSRELLVS